MIGTGTLHHPGVSAAPLLAGLDLDFERGRYRAGGQAYDALEDVPGLTGAPHLSAGGLERQSGDPQVRLTDLAALGLSRRAQLGVRFEIDITPSAQQDSLFPWAFAFNNAGGPSNDRHGVFYFMPAQQWRLLTRFGGPDSFTLQSSLTAAPGTRMRLSGEMRPVSSLTRLNVYPGSEDHATLPVNLSTQEELWLLGGDSYMKGFLHRISFRI